MSSLDRPELKAFITRARDLMASQQAMPDEGALDELEVVVRSAYEMGQEEYQS